LDADFLKDLVDGNKISNYMEDVRREEYKRN